MYIARDEDEVIHIFDDKPERKEIVVGPDTMRLWDTEEGGRIINSALFPEVTWEGGVKRIIVVDL